MNITVFLGSAMGSDPAIRAALCEFAAWIGDHGHALIYGGSRIGLMGLLAETAKTHGARVTGIEPRFFVEACVQFDGADELIVTEDMADRKDKLIRMADVVVAFPGGMGTLEELSQALSMVNLGLAAPRCVVYNVHGYYDPLRDMIDRMVDMGFYPAARRDALRFAGSLRELADAIEGA